MVSLREGGCHCGGVTIAVEMPEDPRPHYCNCSMCAMKGSLAVDVPIAALTVVTGSDMLGCYSFNTGVAQHWFCRSCGIHLFQKLRSDPKRYGVNSVCIDGLGRYDFPTLDIHDGAAAHPKDTGLPTRIAGTMRHVPVRD